jgi:hypothetical protein
LGYNPPGPAGAATITGEAEGVAVTVFELQRFNYLL